MKSKLFYSAISRFSYITNIEFAFIYNFARKFKIE